MANLFTETEIREGIAPLVKDGVECMTCARLLAYTKDALELLAQSRADLVAKVEAWRDGQHLRRIQAADQRNATEIGKWVEAANELIALLKTK